MFKFLFGRGKDVDVQAETQRMVVLRALGEVNEIISGLDPKPAITIDQASGMIALALPEQMPDEALALPKPDHDHKANRKDDRDTDQSSDADGDAGDGGAD